MDIFISYQNRAQDVADKIFEKLQSNNLHCWYAPRIQYGDYAKRITEAIKLCKVFIVLIDKYSGASDHVLNEVELAYDRYVKKEIVIIPIRLDAEPLSESFEYYFARMQWIDAFSVSLSAALNTLLDHIQSALGASNKIGEARGTNSAVGMHESNQYFTVSDFNEVKRLANEDLLLSKFEEPIRDKLFAGKKDLVCLDLNVISIPGCVDKANRPEIGHIIGLTYSDEILQRGKIIVCDKPIDFYKVNFDVDFEEQLARCLAESGVDHIDVVCSCMALMDFKNPFKVLKSIKKFLAPGAVALVREVDDGAVFAHPDKDKTWEQFYSFYKYNVYSGYRYTGRMVYTWFHKLGAKQIKLEHYGISSAGMTEAEKEILFHATTSFMKGDMQRMLREVDANNQNALAFLDFHEEHYWEMEEDVASSDFLFNTCYVIYSVKF